MKKLILLLATAIFTFTACEIIDELGNENNNSNTEQPDEGETPSEGDGETPDSEPKPASNEIWYTNGSTTDATIPNKTDGFGANIVSNLYDDTKECWVATFDGDVTSIGDFAFRSCGSLTSITLPESVTSIGMYAFQECGSLTNITIPENVTSIGVGTFWRCNSLECITIPESVTSISRRTFYSCI